MGGGKDAEVCLIAEVGTNSEPYALELRKAFPDVTFIFYDRKPIGDSAEWFRKRKSIIPDDVWKRTNYLITVTTFPESLDLVPNLKWVHLTTAGINQIYESPVYTDTDDIIITNSSGIHGPQIAEWTAMNMLVARRKYNTTYEWQKKHYWGPNSGLRGVRDHVGDAIGILGYGAIGRQVGRVAQAIGMEVLAYTASPRDTPESRKDNGYIVPGVGDPDGTIPSAWFSGGDKASLHTFLSQKLDYLLVSVPLTPATRGLLSEEEFSILSKSRTFVINIARGPIIDSKALRKSLNDGSLSGAALDVTDPEPLPEDDPLWDAKNIQISPHVSGVATTYERRSYEVFTGNLERYKAGGKSAMWNVVDKRKGY